MEKEQRVMKEVWFTLTEAETIARARQAAEVRNEKLRLEYEMKEHAKEEKERIGKKESELSDLMNQIRTGKECRILSCEMVKDYETKSIKYYFDGLLVDERPMTGEERQLRFDIVHGGVN